MHRRRRSHRLLALAAVAWLVTACAVPVPGGTPDAPPTGAGTAAPSATPAPPTPSPTPVAVLPPAGDVAIGRHSLTLDGVSFSIAIPASGWTSNGSWGIDKNLKVVRLDIDRDGRPDILERWWNGKRRGWRHGRSWWRGAKR